MSGLCSGRIVTCEVEDKELAMTEAKSMHPNFVKAERLQTSTNTVNSERSERSLRSLFTER